MMLEITFKNVYNSIKGHRQEVHYSDQQQDNYFSWILANGWHQSSLGFGLLMIDEEKKEELIRIIELAKSQYPEAFKQ